MSSRLIIDLDPKLQPLCREHVRRCKAEGIDLLITCTFRDNAEQQALYDQGRTKPGKIVTNAKPGQSKHNVGKAYDVVPLRDGKPIWGTTGPDGKLWERVGNIGRSLGLVWAGDWKTFKEFPHFELP